MSGGLAELIYPTLMFVVGDKSPTPLRIYPEIGDKDLEQNNFPVCHFFDLRNLKVSKDLSSSLLSSGPK
jgi:hypothetical protein